MDGAANGSIASQSSCSLTISETGRVGNLRHCGLIERGTELVQGSIRVRELTMETLVVNRYFELVAVAADKLGPDWPNTQDLARVVQLEIDALPDGSEKQAIQDIHAKFVHALVG